jgi:exopolyphosphatase/guanosine-5'-triphosphate,3'-diphosphate pyrophosphatase
MLVSGFGRYARISPETQQVRIAAIDIGTNSIHMVIAEARGSSAFDVVDREREVTQIGRGSFAAGRLRRDAMQRTIEALTRFARLARRHQVDRILCTATAAVREARNGGEFLKAARLASGVSPRVIPTDEEGRLIYLAVKSALQLGEEPSLIVDIGGGSVQLVVGTRDRCLRTFSAPLGALRLTEQWIRSDPPARRDLARLRRRARQRLEEVLPAIRALKPVQVYGSTGSIHAVAQIAHALETGAPLQHLNGHVLAAASLDRLVSRIVRMSQEERERLPGIDAARAEILVPGAVVLSELLSELPARRITLSDFGVREGLVTDYLTFHAREITALQQVEDLRLRSVYALLAKFVTDVTHPRHVARLSLELFDGLQAEHRLSQEARELLLYAALLHDVGSAIGYDGHHEHSAYVIRHGNLRGLSAEEVGIVALVARYHGKAQPRKRDAEFRALAPLERRTVRWLAALLRIAEGLERSHYQLIRSIRVSRRGGRVALRASARREAQLELWAARRRAGLLAELLDRDVSVTLERSEARSPREARSARLETRATPRRARARGRRSAEPPSAPRPSGRAPANGARKRRAAARAAPRRASGRGSAAPPPAVRARSAPARS